MADIVEADVDDVVDMASSWTGLDALDSVPRTDLTPGWDIEPGASVDHCLLGDELMLAKPQPAEGEVSPSLPSNGEQTASETPTYQQPSTEETHVDPVGVDQGLPGWAALGIPFDFKFLRDVFE
ncbi:hypothetical protein R1flu_013995 [Riccia fluitans]|uniref:Uncharacterized protein n=1 Tax=Riccia fluitans TaxID=41844 RepID=A0ABD1YFX9_9MARC